MEERDVECIIAAILTGAIANGSVSDAVVKYAHVLQRLREAGGYHQPNPDVGDSSGAAAR